MGLSTTAFAASSETERIPVPDAKFIEVCNRLFSGNGEVYDANGTDVTNNFIKKYNDAYQNKNFVTILSGCYKDGISQIHSNSTIKENNASTRSVMQLRYTRDVVHLVKQKGFPYDGQSWYFVVTASGKYGYQESTGTIIDFPNPTISTSFHDLGALFTGNLKSIKTTTPVINSSRTSASFKTTTTHTVSCPIPGLDYVTGTLGPFTNTSNFTIKP